MEQQKKNFLKLGFKGASFVAFVFVIGGIGGVYFNQHVLPILRTNKTLTRFDLLKKTAENVTVINNTEQITVKEDDLINEVSAQAANAVVNIVSINKPLQKTNQPSNADNNLRKNGQSGTGIIVTSDGFIATYRSAIIEKDATYKVFLYDGNYYDANLVGVDEFTNLAYLKIDTSNLTAISFANSDDFKPGRKLIAIGNSFGEYQNRFSAGILSNKNKLFNLAGKSVASSEKYEGVIETEFVNKENYLGGPVIGFNGQLVGMIGSLMIDNQTVYFEIPSNAVQKSLDKALHNELGSLPYLGIYYLSLTKEYAIVQGLDRDRGALIYAPSGKQGLAIISNSPAEKAGLKINDLITMVNSQGVNLDNPLSNLLSQYKKGDTIELTVLRDGKEMIISVQL